MSSSEVRVLPAAQSKPETPENRISVGAVVPLPVEPFLLTMEILSAFNPSAAAACTLTLTLEPPAVKGTTTLKEASALPDPLLSRVLVNVSSHVTELLLELLVLELELEELELLELLEVLELLELLLRAMVPFTSILVIQKL